MRKLQRIVWEDYAREFERAEALQAEIKELKGRIDALEFMWMEKTDMCPRCGEDLTSHDHCWECGANFTEVTK